MRPLLLKIDVLGGIFWLYNFTVHSDFFLAVHHLPHPLPSLGQYLLIVVLSHNVLSVVYFLNAMSLLPTLFLGC